MKYWNFLAAIVLFWLLGCAVKNHEGSFFKSTDIFVARDTLTLHDISLNRNIPIALYDVPRYASNTALKKLVILNPGYGGKNTDYGYIAYNLAQNGYFVVVIQHDLPTDDSLPAAGDIYKLRKPVWDRGVSSILFVTRYLKSKNYFIDFNNIILIGHSNGGDMAMLTATEYPNFAKVVITLDNRRVPITRASHPKIFSIRSSDQPADPGVLPSIEEQKKYKIKIVKVNTTHNDMGGMGTDEQKQEINTYIEDYLKSNF